MESDIKRGIYEFHWELTGKCNLNCVYCYNSATNTKEYNAQELSFEEIKRLVEETKDYGTRLFTISGGEALLRPDFFEVMDL